MNTLSLRSLLIMLSLGSVALAQQPGSQLPGKTSPSQEELDKQLARTLSGATLTGHFTVTGQKLSDGLKAEKYTISKVSKLGGDLWIFQVRIQYGDHDLTVPLPLPVKWAGDTPIITLDNLLVPGMGKFTARVIIFRDKYAGTWSAGDHGGHLFGTITRSDDEKK